MPFRRLFLLLFCLIHLALFSGCTSENEDFHRFTFQLFQKELSSNTLNLHFTLKDPKKYQIQHPPVRYPSISSDQDQAKASIKSCLSALHSFSYEKLSEKNQLTYQILEFYLESGQIGTDFLLYQEPLSPSSGIHTQLPLLLSEYPFHTSSDVKDYLELLKQTPEYFKDLIDFEKEKASAGLFMSPDQAKAVISQCQNFLSIPESHYLYTTFEKRIQELSSLDKEEKQHFIRKNAQLLKQSFLPAYQLLLDAFHSLKQSGTNTEGLCYFPEGKAYYQYLIRQNVGLTDSVSKLKDLTYAQILEDLKMIGALSNPSPSLFPFETPSSILESLQSGMTSSFPAIPPVSCEIKYVPSSMEPYLSPAFYLIPAIDDPGQNIIYINRSQIVDSLQLYTTLAHEGYPGHLYQTVFFTSQKPDPLRSILDFGGYVEGWATYAEMMSYYLAPLSKTDAILFQKNSSILLGLYALADIGIHYDGWSRSDTYDFFSKYGFGDTTVVDQIYSLILDTPSNYLKYYLGYLTFYRLKKEMAARLGSDFSQKDFHQAILSVGPSPFPILESEIARILLDL